MSNLLKDILTAAGDEELDIIVFGNNPWYDQWANNSRYNWITFANNQGQPMPHTFDIIKDRLDVEYDAGFGGEDFPSFWAITKSGRYILICSVYDGATGIHRVPTSYRSDYHPEFYGGGQTLLTDRLSGFLAALTDIPPVSRFVVPSCAKHVDSLKNSLSEEFRTSGQ